MHPSSKCYDRPFQSCSHPSLLRVGKISASARLSRIFYIQEFLIVHVLGYWKGLATSVSFPGKTLERCLNVIHCDIVAVWTFEDPRKVSCVLCDSHDCVLTYVLRSCCLAESLKRWWPIWLTNWTARILPNQTVACEFDIGCDFQIWFTETFTVLLVYLW